MINRIYLIMIKQSFRKTQTQIFKIHRIAMILNKTTGRVTSSFLRLNPRTLLKIGNKFLTRKVIIFAIIKLSVINNLTILRKLYVKIIYKELCIEK